MLNVLGKVLVIGIAIGCFVYHLTKVYREYFGEDYGAVLEIDLDDLDEE